MSTKIVAGGIIEKNNRFLLVKENKQICKGKWNIPAGGVDDGENVIEAAKREIFEETGCKVEINGVLEIYNKHMENINVLYFCFNTELINEDIKCDGKEITDIKWFTYKELLNMKEDLRAKGYFLSAIENKINGKVTLIDLIST